MPVIVSKKNINENHEIDSYLKGIPFSDEYEKFAFAYASYICGKNNIKNQRDFVDYLKNNYSEERGLFIRPSVEKFWNNIVHFSIMVDKDHIEQYLKCFSIEISPFTGNVTTPSYEAKLITNILDINNNDSIGDFGCGVGTFLGTSAEETPDFTYYGVDLQARCKEITLIKGELWNRKCDVTCRDMFSIDESLHFDKIVSDPPMGMKPLMYRNTSPGLLSVAELIPGMERATSYTWPIAALITKHLNSNGKAVEVVAAGGLFNSVEKEIRRYFVENHLIEAIISLPIRLSPASSVQTALLVLQKSSSDSIRMIDASNMFTPGRRQNTLSDKNIEDILNCLFEDNEYSKTISISEIRDNEYSLNPDRYLHEQVQIKNGVELVSVVKSITRGAPLKASDLDGMVSDSPTDTQYLTLSNIQNGIIDSNLPYLKELDHRYEKYLIGDNDIILTKNGTPFKSAVAAFGNGRKVIGSGNLYIIHLDESKINPYFLKAFLESEDGAMSLRQCAVGTMIPSISMEALKGMIIPLPPMEVQNSIAEKYHIKEDTLRLLLRQLEKTQSELKSVCKENLDAID